VVRVVMVVILLLLLLLCVHAIRRQRVGTLSARVVPGVRPPGYRPPQG
jgi:hypothetical protein